LKDANADSSEETTEDNTTPIKEKPHKLPFNDSFEEEDLSGSDIETLPKYLDVTLKEINLLYVKSETFEQDPELLAKSRYLFWAAFSGDTVVVL